MTRWVMPAFNLYEAKTGLSQLVERAAKGEEVIIAKAGKPMVKMVPVVEEQKPVGRRVFGHNTMGITYISPDFDEPLWSDEELEEMGLA
jgi:prevent-host-death family protein